MGAHYQSESTATTSGRRKQPSPLACLQSLRLVEQDDIEPVKRAAKRVASAGEILICGSQAVARESRSQRTQAGALASPLGAQNLHVIRAAASHAHKFVGKNGHRRRLVVSQPSKRVAVKTEGNEGKVVHAPPPTTPRTLLHSQPSPDTTGNGLTLSWIQAVDARVLVLAEVCRPGLAASRCRWDPCSAC